MIGGAAQQRARRDHDGDDDESAENAEAPRVFRLVDSVGHTGFRDRDSSKDVRARLRQRQFKQIVPSDEERRAAKLQRQAETDRRSRLRVVSRARGMLDADSWSEFRMYDLSPDGQEDAAAAAEAERREEQEALKRALPKMSAAEAALVCNFMPLVTEYVDETPKESDYVYDLYCQFHAGKKEMESLGGLFGHVESFNEELVYDDDLDVALGEYDVESDSNDEDNWRNDYPDEPSSDEGEDEERRASDDEAVEMRAMERHMKRFVLRDRMATDSIKLTGDDDFVLSSDDEDDIEELMYGITIPEVTTLEDTDDEFD